MANLITSLCSLKWRKARQSGKSREIVDYVVQAHSVLIELPDLRPGPVTNKTLGGLVSICSESHDPDTVEMVLTDPRMRKIIPSMRSISSQSECCLENFWAEKISEAQDSKEALQLLLSFPYFENYVELARLELFALYAVKPTLPTSVAFLGSGPLPLTSMCLLRALRDMQSFPTATDPVVVNVDQDASALSASTVLCEKLGDWSQGMRFKCADAESTMDLREFEVVFLAALVGVNQYEKEEIIMSVTRRMTAGALLVVRSAHSLRTLLYPEVNLNTERLRGVLQVETVTHPFGKIVNSVIVARVK
ncbi:hypothetical protein JX265_006308 [Neoarthrinium moseri]|uniref:Nicotianamine synthase n=1 Tax=Neoarthrinium moseri TaxID=1658444 RepID=A0A9Q0AM00_9PEZI|nr:uncharacterized protein JN550_008301 [Neoarthrinium moseri]KAI1865544.1 hypothetical protein JN550_008301 [Neoarthrinium moseri]KAI1870138.1 hypothetical protein JX265_006308 [Neoarthrinium moseri]